MRSMLIAVWRYRWFVFSAIRTELRINFAGSSLVGLWMAVHPLYQMIMLAFALLLFLKASPEMVDQL